MVFGKIIFESSMYGFEPKIVFVLAGVLGVKFLYLALEALKDDI